MRSSEKLIIYEYSVEIVCFIKNKHTFLKYYYAHIMLRPKDNE